jgi:hypothetical protein
MANQFTKQNNKPGRVKYPGHKLKHMKNLTAQRIYDFLNELIDQGHDLENINILYRYDRDSDIESICEVDEDLFDSETNSKLETIIFLSNPNDL